MFSSNKRQERKKKKVYYYVIWNKKEKIDKWIKTRCSQVIRDKKENKKKVCSYVI